MFTVAHEKPDGTKEFYRVENPKFRPATGDEPAYVDIGGGLRLLGGSVYVMNEDGATVGSFRLGK